MDILELIKNKVDSYDQDFPQLRGVRAVITHLEVAEKYLELAKSSKEDHFYTDIIYRTNHVFEGILKEAYLSIEGKSDSKKKPYEIEQYLIDHSLLKERVLDLFTNYRKDWRNPSTHDYQLFFSEQESFLAIVTVSAFVNILLDQIIESISFRAEKEIVENQKQEIIDSIKNYSTKGFVDKIVSLTLEFLKGLSKTQIKSEAHFIGLLSGYITSIEPDFKIHTEYKVQNGRQSSYIDIMITHNNEKIIFEIKRGRLYSQSELGKTADKNAMEQLIAYMTMTGIRNGILLFTPVNNEDHIVMAPHFINIGDNEFSVYEFRQHKIEEE